MLKLFLLWGGGGGGGGYFTCYNILCIVILQKKYATKQFYTLHIHVDLIVYSIPHN